MTQTRTNLLSVSELAEIVNGRVTGDGAVVIERIADLEHAGESEIAYVEKEDFLAAASERKAACLIVTEARGDKLPNRTLITVANPKLAFSLIGAALHPALHGETAIH